MQLPLIKPAQCSTGTRLKRYGAIGVLGLAVNLGILTALVGAVGVSLAGALANVGSNAGNYVLNNHWTFHDRRRSGLRFLSGYGSYFMCSLVAMVASWLLLIAANRYLTPVLFHMHGTPKGLLGKLTLMGYQFVSVAAGSLLSFKLNLTTTWGPDSGEPELTELKLHDPQMEVHRLPHRPHISFPHRLSGSK